jgi:hypothetical protein
MKDALKSLLEAAKNAKPTAEQREVQRRSFAGGRTFLLRPFSDHSFRGDPQPCDRRRVLQSRTYDLYR